MQSEPQVEALRELKAQLSEARWQARVSQARRRLAVVEALRAHGADGVLHREAVRAVAPQVAWTTARRGWASYQEREGEGWERLVDRRLPDKPWETPEEWKRLVGLLARSEPAPSLEGLRQGLVETFGPNAALSDTTLRKILAQRGLSARAEAREEVVELSGGGALVLVLAALEQTGIGDRLAEAVAAGVAELAPPAAALRPEAPGRDEQGHFTGAYNRARLEQLQDSGGLFGSIERRAGEKDLAQLRVAQLAAPTLAQHLRALVALPLLTERRGTIGVDGPAGAWLEVLGPVAYRAATLDKTLTQLKWLGVGERRWEAHAGVWWHWSRQWAGAGWRQIAIYVDSSRDPWWTQRFAQSGPVSRTGRVQPCLSRVVLSSGPGVPIVAEVASGQAPLKQVLWPLLDQARQVLGVEAVGRLTVIDAECCQLDLIEAFAADPERDLVTVFKGPLARGKSVEALGPWVPFGRGAVREAQVDLTPQAATARFVRIVELRRGEDAPVATRFVSTAPESVLGTVEVAEVYLGRWPYQEDLFRRGRNGLGLERSAGYGAAEVSHVALLEKRHSAERTRQRAEQAYEQAVEAEVARAATTRPRLEQLQQRQAAAANTPLAERHTRSAREALELYHYRQQDTDQARKRLDEAEKHCQKLAGQPETIYQRDTALDTLTTCFKMVLMALLEFVCQEYLGGYRLMPRTFIEAWMALPVAIRQTRHQVIYEIAPNPRDPPMTRRLEQALAVITARRIRCNGRLLVARLRADPNWADSS